mmetsp:Transcript_16228/g.37378  ORF Transcript_16228/g.37378 Transcript_16228/m.37378 type:complete len:441 (-) Transcript_16228:24-1346(-)
MSNSARAGTVPDLAHAGSNTRFVKGSNTAKPSNTDGKGLLEMLQHPLNLLLLCLPLGLFAELRHWGDIPRFWLNFFGMIPLAKILGDATEELAAGLRNDMLAGLLNATFGNAVEMVITVQTLRKGYYELVKATLLGSVLSNMLLVLGMSFFCGGLIGGDEKKPPMTESMNLPPRTEFSATHHLVAEKVQHFHVLGALVNISMLLLSCFSFMIVTIFCSTRDDDGTPIFIDQVLPVSRAGSIIVISAYAAYIIFQLGTHRAALALDEDEDEDGEGEPALSVCMATVVLFTTTVFVAGSSEILVGAIEGVTARNHVGPQFVGIILLPIIGNACEHAAAVRFGIKDKLGLSIGIAIGSSTQIALFVVPFAVLVGWAFDRPMDLNFGQLNTSIMTVSVVVILSMVVDGKSNWLQGYLLMAAYLVVAVCYWYLPGEIEGESSRFT